MGAAAVIGGVMAAGTLISAIGQAQQGKAERKAADFQAGLLEENAALTESQTKEDVRKFRIETRKLQGQSRATIGASGITLEGSAMDILQQNARTAELDALQVKFQGDVKAKSFRDQAKLTRMRGKASESAANTGAASSILMTAGRTYSSFGGN